MIIDFRFESFLRGISLLGMIACFVSSAIAAEAIVYSFDTAPLDETIWCPCQLDLVNGRPTFAADQDDPTTRFMRIVAHEGSLGGNKCSGECTVPKSLMGDVQALTPAPALTDDDGDDAGWDLVPSMFLPEPDYREQLSADTEELPKSKSLSTDRKGLAGTVHRNDQNPYCTPEKLRKAAAKGEEEAHTEGICLQRQEVRFQPHLKQPYGVPHEFALRIRMPEKIANTTDSIRWVIAQWKHDWRKRLWQTSQNPFLAVRFDDGVIHVTVQDESCRCLVASAAHPDPKKNISEWKNGVPNSCRYTVKRLVTHCKPSFSVTYTDPTRPLTSALGQWITLKFVVNPSRKNGSIEIYDGDFKVAEISGKIGYRPAVGNPSIKFKFGQYRDYQPTEDPMDIDWLSVRPLKIP
jgi:hypothetical protein